MIIQFSVISQAVAEDLPRVWNPLNCLGLARSHFGVVSRRRAYSIAQIRSWVAGAVGAISLCGLLGCGEVYLGERKWTCNKQATEYKVTDLLGPEDRLWRFNDDAMGREVNDRGSLTVASPVANALGPAQPIRLGGEGSALVTKASSSSNQTAPAPYANGIPLPTSLTYALWLSLPKSWLGEVGSEKVRKVLLSTKTEKTSSSGCGGHELALQGQKDAESELANVSLVFSYFDAQCKPQVRVAEIGKTKAPATTGLYSLDAWGLGRWYHVAASVSPIPDLPPKIQISLYWDGVKVSNSEIFQVDMAKPQASTTATIHVGSNSSEAPRYEGRIDDVALFQRALSQDELLAFRLNSLSKYGMADQRWTTWDVQRSTASWNDPQTNGIAVTCEDGLSSGCGAAAILNWGEKKMSDFDHIVLSADLPAGKVTDFMLAADQGGRQFCKWTINGIGGADYHLSVKEQAQGLEPSDQVNPGSVNELKWCRCDDCDCAFTVQSATLGSEWTKEVGEYRCLTCDLQPHLSTPPEPEAFKWSRGAKGASHLCWRPIAYDANSHAQFVEAPIDGGSVRATLSGEANTTALLAADFGTTGHRLIESEGEVQGEEVVICANLPPGEFQIILKSANEGYCEMAVRGKDTDELTSTAYPEGERLDATYCKIDDENNPLWGEDGNHLKFDPTHVRYIGIQKAWAVGMEATIRIDSVNFKSDRKSCPKSPVLAGRAQ